METSRKFCRYLRSKKGYFRAADGVRMIDPDSTTACYTCLRTLRPWGPDDKPADADTCGPDRGCFTEER